jgi:hypothetical protein
MSDDYPEDINNKLNSMATEKEPVAGAGRPRGFLEFLATMVLQEVLMVLVPQGVDIKGLLAENSVLCMYI